MRRDIGACAIDAPAIELASHTEAREHEMRQDIGASAIDAPATGLTASGTTRDEGMA